VFVLCPLLQISTLCLYFFWKSFSFSNSSYNVVFSFASMVTLFFKLLISRSKFSMFKLIIAMVWNNSTILLAFITSIATSSTNLGVLVCVVGFLDPSLEDPNSYIILFPSPNSNGCPFADLGLLVGTCISSGLNIAKGGSIPVISFYNSLAYRRPCVCY